MSKAFVNPDTGPYITAPFVQSLQWTPTLPDGFIIAGQAVGDTFESVAFTPYCDAPPGTLIRARLFYWNHVGGDIDSQIWLGAPLVEVEGTISNVAGPYSPNAALLGANDHFCDQITLVAGNLGLTGTIYSFGAGTDLPAFVNCEIQGARLLSFDLQCVDANGAYAGPVNCNALWAKFN